MRNAVGDVQSVLILGGGSEIGQAVARRLVRGRRADVVLAGRHPEDYGDAETALRSAGARAVHAIPFDADDPDSHAQVLDDATSLVGDLDVAVVAFGVLGDQSADEQSAAAAVAVMRTNLLGAVSVLTELGQRMRAQGHGQIVVMSSVAGERVRRSNYVYGASKAGLDGFALGLGEALRGSGVGVLVVRPGFVRSRMTHGLRPAPLSTTPGAVAEVVAAGLQRARPVVWAPAPLRLVMFVLRHLPTSVMRRLPV